jgi:hypothetical protein
MLANAKSTSLTLTEVQAQLGTAKARAADSARSNLPSPAPRPGAVPDLAVTYKATSGASMLVQQRDGAATITLYNTSYQVIGHASVAWDATGRLFKGQAEINFLCGQWDTRILPVTSEIEFYVEPDGRLRRRYSQATKLNCSKREISGWQWAEQSWWPGPV